MDSDQRANSAQHYDSGANSAQHSDPGANSAQHFVSGANSTQHSGIRATDLEDTDLQVLPLCTRFSLCLKQSIPICGTPTNHVRNLSTKLNAPAMPTTPNLTTLPLPLTGHIFHHLLNGFQVAILENNLGELILYNDLYLKTVANGPPSIHQTPSHPETHPTNHSTNSCLHCIDHHPAQPPTSTSTTCQLQTP